MEHSEQRIVHYITALKERTGVLEKRLKEHKEGDTCAILLIKEGIRQIAIDAVNML